ncbi:hypothetical protein PBI_MISSWHITE_71 [Mycobacterium phage MissWhite]|nr:hypothetical protein PBI_MISSWHITE_71 [Mycobacterium phage MissWhite]
MKTHKKTLDLSSESEYTFVEMGPIPDLPPWHQQSHPSRFPFPTPEAAQRFAQAAAVRHPGREVVIAYPDGRRWNGQEFVA